MAVIEWAEKLQGVRSVEGREREDLQDREPVRSGRCVRWVRIETVSEKERRITYEDSGD